MIQGKKIYFTCPSQTKGGFYCYDKNLEKLSCGNCRGLTNINENILYVKSSGIHFINKQIVELDSLAHDIKYDKKNKCFYVMLTESRKIQKITFDGFVVSQMSFSEDYWPNCCLPWDGGIFVFLSKKRPYSKSKILFLDEKLNQAWSYNCFDNDEIHSPCILGQDLYWCRSNWNTVVRATIESELKNIQTIILNNNGYTRGLYIDDQNILLGTSSNRHKENSNCKSYVNNAVLHLYDKNFTLKNQLNIPEEKEIYDVMVL